MWGAAAAIFRPDAAAFGGTSGGRAVSTFFGEKGAGGGLGLALCVETAVPDSKVQRADQIHMQAFFIKGP
jgi:hypothetical protein